MTPPSSADSCQTCPVHPEFVKRLDNRWNEHQEAHAGICDKLNDIFERLERQNQKLNWLLGGVAVICPMLLIFVQLLISHLGGK